MIIKRLSEDRAARDAQLKLYGQHLRKQYQDRVVYWTSRSSSRLRSILPWGGYNLTMILDGVDHSKFRYPRSAVLSAKEFSTMNRPAMDVHGILAHGHGAYLALSEPFTPKDSSWCTELFLHTLHRMQTRRGADLRQFEVCVQSDNTSRECKNNSLLRVIALLTGLHKVKRGELRCLMTAHSHEDVDSFFAHMLSHVECHKELHTPGSFLRVLNTYLGRPETRPNEPDTDAFMVHDIRDWQLVSSNQNQMAWFSQTCFPLEVKLSLLLYEMTINHHLISTHVVVTYAMSPHTGRQALVSESIQENFPGGWLPSQPFGRHQRARGAAHVCFRSHQRLGWLAFFIRNNFHESFHTG